MADAAMMAAHPDAYIGCNFDVTFKDQCTLQTCCLAQSSFLYRPNFGANLFFAIFFGAMAIPQIGLGIYYKTYGFMIAMLFGLALEVVGYVARVLLYNNPFNGNAFLIYLICATIAPVFITAAIYLTITRIIVLYGAQNSYFKPRTVAIAFMFSDFTSLVLQGAGGGIADTADTKPDQQVGVNVMIAGLILQVVSLFAFAVFCAYFAWRSRTGVLDMAREKIAVRERWFFKAFLGSLFLATLVIFVRSVFRVAELWQGFDGTLWNKENDFLVLDGAMMGIAVVALAAFHPGPAFLGQWAAANWSFRAKKTPVNMETRSKETRRDYSSDA
ncbi:phospholipid-translocating ATPase rsb1 [Oleoguttula sp. CCFEE 5521]